MKLAHTIFALNAAASLLLILYSLHSSTDFSAKALVNGQYTGAEGDFEAWAKLHQKQYRSESEVEYRRRIWAQSLKYVSEHNAAFKSGKVSFSLSMNAFADFPNSEFAALYTDARIGQAIIAGRTQTDKCTGPQAPSSNLPQETDWIKKGAVTPAYNQGMCGSSWAFSAVGSIEGSKFLKDGKLTPLSVQQVLECSGDYGNQNCNGGYMEASFWYVIDNGIALESKYPYTGQSGRCHYTQADRAFSLSNCVAVTPRVEKALLASLAQQPVAVVIDASSSSFQLYHGGVYTGNCTNEINHPIVGVGYGELNGKAFYAAKNSWGTSWGISGSVLLERIGDGPGKCGIQILNSFSIA